MITNIWYEWNIFHCSKSKKKIALCVTLTAPFSFFTLVTLLPPTAVASNILQLEQWCSSQPLQLVLSVILHLWHSKGYLRCWNKGINMKSRLRTYQNPKLSLTKVVSCVTSTFTSSTCNEVVVLLNHNILNENDNSSRKMIVNHFWNSLCYMQVNFLAVRALECTTYASPL
mgnify:CR=1 FL=1